MFHVDYSKFRAGIDEPMSLLVTVYASNATPKYFHLVLDEPPEAGASVAFDSEDADD